MAKDWQAVADAINARMEELGMSQQELASRSRVSVAALRQIQKAVPKERNPRTLAAISEALGWPSNRLEDVAAGSATDEGADRLARLESEVADLREKVADLEKRVTRPSAG